MVAVLSAVAMSNVTPPGPAGAERLTVNVKVVVPASPSARETSSMERFGRGGAPHPAVLMTMSSIPTHSSLPVAFVVMTRSWTSDWLLTAAGSTTQTFVT